MHKSYKVNKLLNLVLAMGLILAAGCNLPTATQQSKDQGNETPNLQETTVTFKVKIDQPIPAGDSIYISILDEVTGLAFNPNKYVMQAESAQTYQVSLPLQIGSVIKYRYSREGASIVNEHLYNDRPVRYRLYHVEGPRNVEDVISRWTDTEYLGHSGRIMGQITDSSTGGPIPNILVTAAGEQALSLADGTFLLEGLPPGTHNLVLYALDGAYHVYQQGAVVASDSTTPVSLQLDPAKLVTIIFAITVPADTPSDAPIRLAGNLSQLGNTYADLSGGVSTLASWMPTLGKLADGRYMATLSLPAGTYLEYKYTLGDGLWSTEVTSEGSIQLRRLLVPDKNLEVNDTVESWKKASTSPIRFEVKVPANTPVDEGISIQFNPGFGWLEPLSMWPASSAQGEAAWRFDLTGPFNDLTALHYRYCRQGQCGSADDVDTMGINPVGRLVDPSANPKVVNDEFSSWAWLSNPEEAANVPDVQVSPRGTGFIAGVSFQPNYHPSWEPILSQAINNVNNLKVNWLVLTPTWTFTNDTPPILEPQPARDMLYPALINTINKAKSQGLNVGLFPEPNFPDQASAWWQGTRRDYSWWVSFFERYTNFILHHASIASSSNAASLILGGDWLNPALPGGLLDDGSPSNVPQDAEARWRDLIQKVRERYRGTIAWAVSYPNGITNPPPFLDAVDQVYILWSAPLATQPNTTMEDMHVQANLIFSQEILPYQLKVVKPIVIAISYPSIDWGTTGCIAILGGGCLNYDLLIPPSTDITALPLNLQDQANAYNSVLSAINENDWVSGFVSMGYYPPAILQDKSTSIHGKPASGVVWYWSQKFLGR